MVSLEVIFGMVTQEEKVIGGVHKRKGIKRWGSSSFRKRKQNSEEILTYQENNSTLYSGSRSVGKHNE